MTNSEFVVEELPEIQSGFSHNANLFFEMIGADTDGYDDTQP